MTDAEKLRLLADVLVDAIARGRGVTAADVEQDLRRIADRREILDGHERAIEAVMRYVIETGA